MGKQIHTGLNIDNTFINELEGFYQCSEGDALELPKIIKFNNQLADELGFDFKGLDDSELAHLLTGSHSVLNSKPVSQIYAGHQFGGFSPQLGDGRAILIAEVIDKAGLRKDIHLKGSGKTPFSRGGDGKAALGPVLREYIMGEAMHALNVPATRGLAVTLTGEKVIRKKLESGAVLARTASSHIRVGTFQYFAAINEQEMVKQLADYTIKRHFPELSELENPYIGLIREVRNKQAALVAQWQLVGFVHGVMNTDNVAVSGETIDFGPCAFIDSYDSSAVFSSIDRQGRYSYGNQPYIGQWNLARFAECLLPLINLNTEKAIELATEEINDFSGIYQAYWLQGVCKKIGLSKIQDKDQDLANELFEMLEGQDVDFTNFFRNLSDASIGNVEPVSALFNNPGSYDLWHTNWLKRLKTDPQTEQQRVDSMNAVNPIYIPRNHIVESVITAAENVGNYQPFEELLKVLGKPFEQREGLDNFARSAPKEFAPYKTYCGT